MYCERFKKLSALCCAEMKKSQRKIVNRRKKSAISNQFCDYDTISKISLQNDDISIDYWKCFGSKWYGEERIVRKVQRK